MKKFVEFTVARKQETTVVVQYDDRDIHPSGADEQFACDVLSRDGLRSKPRYEWSETDIYVSSRRACSTDEGYEAEVMPRPDDWLLKRVRLALDGLMTGCAFGIPGSEWSIEECPGSSKMLRRAVKINGQRLYPENGVIRLTDIINDDGSLDTSRFSDFVDELPSTASGMSKSDVVWHELRRRVDVHLEVKMEKKEFERRFREAFGWDENGRCV